MSSGFGKRVASIILIALLSACGGGSDGESDNANAVGEDGAGTPDNSDDDTNDGNSDDNNDDDSDDGDTASPITHLVSGNVSFLQNTVVDQDLATEDLSTVQLVNNSRDDAQLLPHNLVQVQGFSASGSDERDVYRVFLQEGQSISLDVVDFSDIQGSGGQLVLSVTDVAGAQSLTSLPSQAQTLAVPIDSEYFIEVSATLGASKYILSLEPSSPSFGSSQLTNDEATSDSGADDFGLPVAEDSGPTSPALTLREALVHWQNEPDSWRFDVVDLSEIYPDSNLDWSDANTTWAAIQQLNLRNDVAYAEPNYLRQAQVLVPNDPLYGAPLEALVFGAVDGTFDLSQSINSIPINENINAVQVVDSTFVSQYHYEQINLPEAWEEITVVSERAPGEGVIVAVADTGVVLEHEDLVNKLTSDGFDFISIADIASDNESDGIQGDIDSNPDDPGDGADIASSSWHGTHVAATVAAESNNNIGVAGVAWETRIMPLRVLGQGGGASSDIMNALTYAAGLFDDLSPDQNADIINLSLGGGAPSQAEQAVIDAVRGAGLFIVAAAGNDGTDTLSFPASYEGVVSVAAINARKERAFYSQFNEAVDIAAPGGEFLSVNAEGNAVACIGVLSAFISDDGSGGRASSYNCLQGTSMATPHVSGVIALMKSVYPDLTPDEFDSLLSSGELTDDLGAEGKDDQFGHGLINAEKAIQAAARLAAAVPLALPQLEISADILTFDDAKVTNDIELTNVNIAADNPVVTVQSTADWIAIDATQTDNGLGRYTLSVDTQGFGTGEYLALLQFVPDQGNTVSLSVQLTVGAPETDHPQAPHFVLFISESGDVFETTEVQTNGDYQIELVEGDYRVISGTDIDTDSVICQLGETCGGIGSLLENDTVTIGSDLSDLGITVQLLGSNTVSPALFERTDIQQTHGAFAAER